QQGGGLAVDPAATVQHELGEEGVEVGEMPVQDTFRTASLGGDRPAGQRARPGPEQDALGGVEQLLTRVPDGDPCRHRTSVLSSARPGPVDEWAPAHYGGRVPTIPPGSRPELHQHRQIAESFGNDTERYDRTRPRYPQALVDRIVAASPGPDLLDVGCGTGTEARQFQAAGCAVLGVEPDDRMAAFARRTGVMVEVATLEAWDPAGR